MFFAGVYSKPGDTNQFSAGDGRDVSAFSDLILRIRDTYGMEPDLRPSEMLAEVLRDRTEYPSGFSDAARERDDSSPCDRYFGVYRAQTGSLLGFAALDGSAVNPPHVPRIKEIGLDPRLPNPEMTHPGLLALLIGGVVLHVDQQIVQPLRAEARERARLAVARGAEPTRMPELQTGAMVEVNHPFPAEAGTAMQALGFDRTRTGFEAPTDVVRQVYDNFVISLP